MTLPPVIHEDETLLAFDKPSGMLVAPDRWDKSRANLMALVHAKLGPGVANVHRLDADTSGVLLCAKTKAALDFLSGQFQAKTAEKVYHALVTGIPAQDGFTIELALREDESRPGRMRTVKRGGKAYVTRFRVLERYKGFAWLECRPLTGRTHQIRVHLAAAGHPVLNDAFYGHDTRLLLSNLKRGYKGRAEERPLIARLALHASELTVTHPVTHERHTVRAPLPHELNVALKYLRRFAAIRSGRDG
ncbi:MAG: RNA pseudouridine synthase [Verrucomicrobia bacterium RIFCSPLOWO2_12_FULL_64_8]|nr:MAG: RNA pseudouridine synthase [Verrucomicrobia bacterium RIFCSPLOWO2_12_FULL_64_8]